MDQETVAVYDKKIDDYIELTKKENPDKSLMLFINRMPKQGTVLDLGCGPGASAAAMKEAGLIVDATDASSEMVRVANELFDINARVAVFHDVNNIDHYDGIWANFSLLHATEAEFVDILPRLHLALKPEAILYLGMKTGDGVKRDHLGRRYTYYTEQRLEELLAEANFEIIATKKGEGLGMAGDVEPFILITSRATREQKAQ